MTRKTMSLEDAKAILTKLRAEFGVYGDQSRAITVVLAALPQPQPAPTAETRPVQPKVPLADQCREVHKVPGMRFEWVCDKPKDHHRRGVRCGRMSDDFRCRRCERTIADCACVGGDPLPPQPAPEPASEPPAEEDEPADMCGLLPGEDPRNASALVCYLPPGHAGPHQRPSLSNEPLDAPAPEPAEAPLGPGDANMMGLVECGIVAVDGASVQIALDDDSVLWVPRYRVRRVPR